MSEWQDIESAPKDGTEIDIWLRNGERWTNVWWAKKKGFRDYSGYRVPDCEGWFYNHDDASYLIDGEPTHWMPLPAAPLSGE